MGRAYEGDCEVSPHAACDGPCRRENLPVACFDNSGDEYPPVQLCGECLATLAAELLAPPSPKT